MKLIDILSESIDYLASKKVPFIVKNDHLKNTISIIGVSIQVKQGKTCNLYYANNKRISKKMANLMIRYNIANIGKPCFQQVI